jgi:hypothetical protein
VSRRKTLNERRLTKKQVAALVAEGARPRPDLEQEFADAGIGLRRPRIYELQGGRILQVFTDQESGLGGRGDIYTIDYFQRFIAWSKRVDANAKAWRNSSVSHWFYHSKLRTDIPSKAPALIEELRGWLRVPRLEMSYAGLDAASRYVDAIGFERAQETIYDHLVAYVGEVMRSRTHGSWMVETRNGQEPYPYVAAPKHSCIMPVNVVWSELDGLDSADLRREAANEVRRARMKYFP